MLSWYKVDLHIHTVLSACAELSMGPKDIVRRALEEKLDIIAITDHNSAENVSAVLNVAESTELTVIPGMEVYSRDEAHIICLFESIGDVLAFQSVIYAALSEGDYDSDMFGEQIICDADENILGESCRFLSLPVNLNVDQIADYVVEFNGMMIPAHVDRRSHSLLRVLSFMPNNLPIDAMEIAHSYENACRSFGILKDKTYSVIRSSDAHDIDQIGKKYSWFKLKEKSFKEIRKALRQQDGRKVVLDRKEPCENCH